MTEGGGPQPERGSPRAESPGDHRECPCPFPAGSGRMTGCAPDWKGFSTTPAPGLGAARVGLVANPTTVDRRLAHAADLLHQHPDVDLRWLFGPSTGCADRPRTWSGWRTTRTPPRAFRPSASTAPPSSPCPSHRNSLPASTCCCSTSRTWAPVTSPTPPPWPCACVRPRLPGSRSSSSTGRIPSAASRWRGAVWTRGWRTSAACTRCPSGTA